MDKIFDGAGFDFFPTEGRILEEAAREAFSRLSFTFTRGHVEALIAAALDGNSSGNDRYVCASMLENARVAAEGRLALCQDTGIATAFGWAAEGFRADGSEREQLREGARRAYDERRLRFSTSVPTSFWDERDPGDNMPPQLALFAGGCSLAPEPEFVKALPRGALGLLFVAKGGGSSNKTAFIQGTKAFLNRGRFADLMREQISALGTSACPPYSLAVVAGGLSPEQNLLALKLATAGAYSDMTREPNETAFRDAELEGLAMEIASGTGFGAQFGGRAFALSATVVRLPRHGASCPISFGVSCSAHRNLRAVVADGGFYLEKTATDPASLPGFAEAVAVLGRKGAGAEIRLDADEGIPALLEKLRPLKAGTRLLLSGKLLVARDAAHARWKKLLDEGRPLPDYAARHPICYAGPARKPDGAVIGSFGPTTAGRMDVYADCLMSRGASLVTLAKGNRSRAFTEACARHGAVYLGTPGGVAALIASRHVVSEKVVDYGELGMEAVRLVEVRDLPCFVLTAADGEDFYADLGR